MMPPTQRQTEQTEHKNVKREVRLIFIGKSWSSVTVVDSISLIQALIFLFPTGDIP